MTRRLLGLSLGIGALALLAAACGGSDGTATPDLTAERARAEYLGKVTAINARFDEAFRGVEETLTTAWPTRGRLLSVLSEIDIGGVFEGAVADLKALTPPPDYQADHQRYSEFREQIVPFMAAQDQAIDDGDLVSLALARMNEALLRQRMLADISFTYCRAITAPNRMAEACGSGEPVPGGDYGAQLHAVLRDFSSEFGARVGAFLLAFEPEEFFQVLRVVQPEVVPLLEATGNRVKALEPTEEFRADHDRLVQYFEDTLEVSLAINKATEEADFPAMDREFQRSGFVASSANRQVSAAYRPIVAPLFGPEAPE